MRTSSAASAAITVAGSSTEAITMFVSCGSTSRPSERRPSASTLAFS
jgi:hypothetical protein